MLLLAKYFDLVWCLHNNFGRTLVFFDDAYDLYFFAQVIAIWGIWESWKIRSKDNGGEVLVVCMKIEKTNSS